jgi:hypothetical protein
VGGKVRRGKARGHGATVLLHLLHGARVDRRQAPVRAVDRIAEGLARQLGARSFRGLRQAEACTVFHTATMHVMAAALAAEFLRTGDLGVYEKYAAAVANVRRLLASLGLQPAEVEEVTDLERALRQNAQKQASLGAGREQSGEVVV